MTRNKLDIIRISLHYIPSRRLQLPESCDSTGNWSLFEYMYFRCSGPIFQENVKNYIYSFFIYSVHLWNTMKVIYALNPSFLTNATDTFVAIGNTTFENQATIIYGLEKFTLESFSVNKRDMKIEVGIKIPIIKVRKINFKLLFCSTSYSIYGTCFLSAKVLFTQHCREPSLLLYVDRLYNYPHKARD